MKKAFYPFLFLIFLFAACSKEAQTDDREKFVGTWDATITVSMPSVGLNESDQYTLDISKSTENEKKIIVDTYSANVSGSSYTYDQFTETYTDPTFGPVTFIFNGTGSISGSTINESGTLKTTIQGVQYNGTWTRTLKKK